MICRRFDSAHVFGDEEEHSILRLAEVEGADHVGMLESLRALAILGKLIDEVGGGNIPGRNQLQGANPAAGRIQSSVDRPHADFRDLIEDFIALGNQAALLPTLEEGGNGGGLADVSFSRGSPRRGRHGRERRRLLFRRLQSP